MLDFERQLVDEYCDLRNKIDKLQYSLDKGDEFKDSIGKVEYDLLCEQLKYMKSYFDVLDKRIDDLRLRVHVPVIWYKDMVCDGDEMLSRDKILTKAYNDCLREMYYKSQPSASYDEYVNKYKRGELTDKDRIFQWHYLSQDEYQYIVDKYVSAYGMNKKWCEYIDTVIEYFDKGAIKDKWVDEYTDERGEWHPGYRGYEKLDDFSKVIEEAIDANKEKSKEEIGKIIKGLVLKRIEECKNFYRFDREEIEFKANMALGVSPTSNPETVKEYWKKMGKDIEIIDKDPDTLWERDYYGESYEEYIEDLNNKEY